MKRKTILDVIKEKTVEVGDCMEWTGYCNGRVPSTSVGGRGMSVRSLVALRLGWPIDGKVVTNRCGNHLCVNPDHLRMMTKSQFHTYVTQTKIDQQALSRRMKLSKSVRQRSKLTLEQAQAIKAHPGPHHVIAKEFGVCMATVSSIRTGKTWRDFGMFAQLWITP